MSVQGPIHVVFCADDGYALPLGVAASSVARHCREALVFHIVEDHIRPGNKRKVEEAIQAHGNAVVEWIPAPSERTRQFHCTRHFTRSAFSRLFLPELLPASVTKVIYLDCDVLAVRGIEELWQVDMGDRLIMAAQDIVPFVSSKDCELDYVALGIPERSKYFNSGVVILNLQAWRTSQVASRILAYLQSRGERLQKVDQEGLNAVLFDRWGELDAKWNQQGDVVLGSPYLHERTLSHEGLSHPHIIHFTHGKPWSRDCDDPRRTVFFRAVAHTPWWCHLPMFLVFDLRTRVALALWNLRNKCAIKTRMRKIVSWVQGSVR